MRILSGAILLGAAGLACSSAPALASHPFDGRWSVEVITEKGSCDRAYRWDLTISGGRVLPTPDMPARAAGSVSSAGVVSVRISRGDDSMTATGKASGNWATGAWASPSLSCSGRWRAERRM